jgi:hypothetical protein
MKYTKNCLFWIFFISSGKEFVPCVRGAHFYDHLQTTFYIWDNETKKSDNSTFLFCVQISKNVLLYGDVKMQVKERNIALYVFAFD